MNTELKQAAQQAVEALIEARRYVVWAYECAFPDRDLNESVIHQIDEAVTAIQQAESEQAPMMKHQVIDAALIVAPTLWVDYMCAVSFEAGIRAAEAHHGITDAPTASDA